MHGNLNMKLFLLQKSKQKQFQVQFQVHDSYKTRKYDNQTNCCITLEKLTKYVSVLYFIWL